MTIPNRYSFARIFRVLQRFTNKPLVNSDHTCHFTPNTLKVLAKKSNLVVKKISYAHFPFAKDSYMQKLNRTICRLSGNKFKEQIIVVLAKG